MRIRKSNITVQFLSLFLLILISGMAGAAEKPVWQITEHSGKTMELSFQMPVPEFNEVMEAGQIWHTPDMPGSVIQGTVGEPQRPVFSRLVSVPRGMKLSAEVISAESTTVSGLQIFPVQDPSSEEFSFSAPAYALNTAGTSTKPEISVGTPAIVAGQTVVPLTINPVSYNPTGKQALIWTEIRLELQFIADDKAPATAAEDRPLPRSFASRFETQVLGFNSAHSKATSEPSPIYGTYVAVYSGSIFVQAGIAPLLQWRREQGYNVIELNTALSGGAPVDIKNALKSIYDDTSIPPLEFITIFGDVSGSYPIPAWFEDLSGYGGGGDHYYSTLDGDDILADVHIGRVSFTNDAEMNTVIGKILGYEKNPPVDDPSWYGRACLQGDPSASGITTIYTNQWLKGQLLDHGWSQVDTTWSGNFVTPMMAQVGQGVTAYGYRGFYGTSGIGNGHVMALGNGGKLAMALLPTCDSGSFASATACRSEAWLRAPNGGAVAAIGTATTGTHTRYNNCYYLGTWDGLLNSGDYRIGVAHTLGKMELYSGYFLAEPAHAEIWAVWNNVMGDPATEMWTGVPKTLEVAYPTQISLGGQAITISVTDEGVPAAGVRVCLFQPDSPDQEEFQISGLTDENGQLMLNIPALGAGTVHVTATGHNYLPHLGGLTVGQAEMFCAVTGRTINSGGFNPGKTVSFTPRLTNHGSTDAFGVSAELTVSDGPANVSDGNLVFGNIAAAAEVASTAPITMTIAPDARDGSIISLLLTATNGSDIWTSMLEETVQAASFNVSDMDLSDFGGSLDPGESGHFNLTLENTGSLDATAISATLSTDSPWIYITSETAVFGDLAVGASGQSLMAPWQLSISTDCFGGHLAHFQLTVNYSDGMQTTTEAAAMVGTAETDQPTGPDQYGYYAFDNTDTHWPTAPQYDWVGIDPDHGGQGADLLLTDFGWEQDDTKTIDLPFAFGFYGTTYARASICSNGWLAMGETPVNFYRNFPLPAAHSAGALIAPFWDNLYQEDNHRVYTWYDEDGHRFIIQWYGMNNSYSDAPQNFEVILLDPAYHLTGTGDGMIIFQYDQVNNTDNRDGYATVGIQNMARTDGLNYTYWDRYTGGAATLIPGRAILFAPLGDIALPTASVTPGSLNESVLPGQQVTQYLHLSNTGDEGSVLNFSISKIDPATVVTEKTESGSGETRIQPTSLNGSFISSTVEYYEPGTTIDLPLSGECHSSDGEWLMFVKLDLPEGVTVNSASGFSTPNGVMPWNSQTGEAVLTTWGSGGVGSSGYLGNNQSGATSVNLSFDPDLSGPLVLTWYVSGDNWGEPPHEITGEIILTVSTAQIEVSEPSAGAIAFLGDELSVNFTAINGPEIVNIAIQHENDGPWDNLAFALPADSSPWSWTVSGAPGPYARIRVSDATDPSVYGLSGIFTISRNLDWLQLDSTEGQIISGQTVDLAVTMNSTGLDDGTYEASLIIVHNGGPAQTVPVNFTVSDVSAAAQLPQSVALHGNHPNPFNPHTTISFSLPNNQDISLRIYSARGRLVQSLLQGLQPAGMHHALWDGRDNQGRTVASGVYFYRLVTDSGSLTGKMVLTK